MGGGGGDLMLFCFCIHGVRTAAFSFINGSPLSMYNNDLKIPLSVHLLKFKCELKKK